MIATRPSTITYMAWCGSCRRYKTSPAAAVRSAPNRRKVTICSSLSAGNATATSSAVIHSGGPSSTVAGRGLATCATPVAGASSTFWPTRLIPSLLRTGAATGRETARADTRRADCGSGPGPQFGGVLLPGPLDHERVEHPHRSRQEALHVGAVVLAQRGEHHAESDGPLATGDLGDPVLAESTPLLLRERHRREWDDLLLFVVEVS